MAWQYRKYSHAAFWKQTSTPWKENQGTTFLYSESGPCTRTESEFGTNRSPAILELEILDWIDLMRESKPIREGEI